jgi:hypothetical protein
MSSSVTLIIAGALSLLPDTTLWQMVSHLPTRFFLIIGTNSNELLLLQRIKCHDNDMSAAPHCAHLLAAVSRKCPRPGGREASASPKLLSLPSSAQSCSTNASVCAPPRLVQFCAQLAPCPTVGLDASAEWQAPQASISRPPAEPEPAKSSRPRKRAQSQPEKITGPSERTGGRHAVPVCYPGWSESDLAAIVSDVDNEEQADCSRPESPPLPPPPRRRKRPADAESDRRYKRIDVLLDALRRKRVELDAAVGTSPLVAAVEDGQIANAPPAITDESVVGVRFAIPPSPSARDVCSPFAAALDALLLDL